MSWHAVLYYAALLCSLFYTFLRGGRPEKAGAIILTCGSFATMGAHAIVQRHYQTLDIEVLTIDLAVLAGFVWLSLQSDRFWPAAAAGMQLATIAIHLVKAAMPDLNSMAYSFGMKVWGYVILAAIYAGTWRHRARTTRQF